ncbi:MAG: ion transporter [Chloroflexi bacterium]|nr:ion transporter [Chloroflexota bacterium]
MVLVIIAADVLLQGLETVPAMAGSARFFYWAGAATWLLFTIEWCLRIRRAENWRSYAFSFMGIVDFLAILPLWLLTGFDLKALRAFRLFRLFRSATRVAGRTDAVDRLARAFAAAKDEAGVLLSGTGVLIVTTGFGMYHLENEAQPTVFGSVLDGLWWAVITLTTVGYGDAYPVTAGGRLLATVAMFAGIGVIGAACGIMAGALLEVSRKGD